MASPDHISQKRGRNCDNTDTQPHLLDKRTQENTGVLLPGSTGSNILSQLFKVGPPFFQERKNKKAFWELCQLPEGPRVCPRPQSAVSQPRAARSPPPPGCQSGGLPPAAPSAAARPRPVRASLRCSNSFEWLPSCFLVPPLPLRLRTKSAPITSSPQTSLCVYVGVFFVVVGFVFFKKRVLLNAGFTSPASSGDCISFLEFEGYLFFPFLFLLIYGIPTFPATPVLTFGSLVAVAFRTFIFPPVWPPEKKLQTLFTNEKAVDSGKMLGTAGLQERRADGVP